VKRFSWDEVCWDWNEWDDPNDPKCIEQIKISVDTNGTFTVLVGTFGRDMVFIDVLGTDEEKINKYIEEWDKIAGDIKLSRKRLLKKARKLVKVII